MAETELRESTLVRLPASLKDAVREQARANRRSMTQEITVMLERAVNAASPERG